jgi:periplasmic copper chaperone A
MTKIPRLTIGAIALALVAAPAAAAHVTVNPREAEADSFARFAVRVPNEKETGNTIAVTVQLPEGLSDVAFQAKPGWTRSVTMAKLANPITVEGETVTDRVATVTWRGGAIAPGEFDEFGISAHVPNTPGRTLVFPALQTYTGGEVVRWIGAPDADEPAPRVALTAAAGENNSSPTATTTTEAAAEDESDDDGDRSNLALGIAIAGLAAGLVALGVALFRRPGRA